MSHIRIMVFGVIALLVCGVALAEGLTGEGVTGAEALASYNKAKANVLKQMAELELQTLSVSGLGTTMVHQIPSKQMAMMMGGGPGGGGAGKPKAKIVVAERIRLKLSDVDKMSAQSLSETLVKVLDAGTKAGLKLNGGGMPNIFTMQQGVRKSLITFTVGNLQGLRSKAYKVAVAQARARAEELAVLAGLKLGAVSSLHDAFMVGAPVSAKSMMEQMYGATQAKPLATGASNALADITVKVKLTMTYAIK